MANNIKNAAQVNHKIVKHLFPDGSHKSESNPQPFTSHLTIENLIDLLLPTADSLVGPLVFIGTSILELNEV